LLVLLVNAATEETAIKVLLVNCATVDVGVDQSWKAFFA
jgi:hypothetical protein